jgi:2-oxoglutarate dehydrogenase E2 component (dihydrolipoamide succinyltransferase)
MSLVIKVPEVGESITEVTIATWLKQDGDMVEMDELICELESDKATFELPAEAAGILRIKAQEGDVLEIGATICEIDTEGAAPSKPAEVKPPAVAEAPVVVADAPKATGETIEMRVPEVGESITEVTISSWLKEDGDFVELDEIIAEIDSDKATFELPAEGQGLLRQVAKDGDTLQIGDLICKIELMEGSPVEVPASTAPAATTTSEPATAQSYASGHASPAAAKILDEKGIPSGSVAGTGVGGRITKEDALKAEQQKAAPEKKAASAPAVAPAVTSGERVETRKKMSSLRKTVARRLVSVKNETAMLTTFNEVDMKPIMDLRKKYKESFKEKYGVGLGFMSFFTKAVCEALLEWPAVNGMIDGDELIYHDYCDISIAVSAPKGLVVPVIRNAETLSFEGIEKEVVRLATKARDNKLTIPEMTGGTFTLTNGGVFGSMMSTPIINAPQSAILGMHNIVERAVVVNGEIVVRPMMYLALSYDHRIIDGRESVSFLVRVKQLLEDPARLMLGV